ncbi:uncharacterized protein G2W53_034460 [Senna tora]|uniref:Uncharacterized protein n=1 Tax=Senna tora TaxID=362788 RepID=A0A834WDR9_9FABA|nr:uncharacterized protein G2W53_034460 [Senna tora]
MDSADIDGVGGWFVEYCRRVERFM